LADYHKNGKGFVVVDFDGAKPVVKRVTVDVPREFIERNVKYEDLESGIAAIKELIRSFDKKPIIKLTITDVDSDTSLIYDVIREELGDLALMIRPTFMMKDDVTPYEVDPENPVGPEQLIEKRLEGYGGSEVTTLAIDLYHLLSKDKLDESQELIDQFFNDHYKEVTEDVEFKTEEVKKPEPPEEKEDMQVTFKEVLE
jgi:hypothetical protein